MALTKIEIEDLEDSHSLEEIQMIQDGIKFFGKRTCIEAHDRMGDEGSNSVGWELASARLAKNGNKEYLATLYGQMLLDAGYYLVRHKILNS